MEHTKPQVLSIIISLSIVMTITALKFMAGNAIGHFVKSAFGCFLESLAG
ncbi:hypothetical protein [Siminovitchia fordii]|uniref:Uncharacterized protein n=1 Tax=Siminovitchia fordii TaxID=254759 RepID=A0ABQ4K5H0_9BACI|nr:hypothetical protein [Siminovitchia fordii]GIN20974.1 hypothetical protein J1TS3_21080 [Siminovitchia fordii]